MPIATSTIERQTAEADGGAFVYEAHTDDAGKVYTRTYRFKGGNVADNLSAYADELNGILADIEFENVIDNG